MPDINPHMTEADRSQCDSMLARFSYILDNLPSGTTSNAKAQYTAAAILAAASFTATV